MHLVQGRIFSRKSKKWCGNKLWMLVLMMDEGSVVERAHITVVPLTAVLRIYLLPKSKCALSSKNPESRFRMCFGGYGLSAHFTKKRKKNKI